MSRIRPGHLSDTHPDVETVHINLLREAGTGRRLSLAFSMTQTALRLSLNGIRRRHPHLSDQECRLMLAELSYGKELTDRVRAYLEAMHLGDADLEAADRAVPAKDLLERALDETGRSASDQ
jgi:hypothetical protein